MNFEPSDPPIKVFSFPFVSVGVLLQSQMILDYTPPASLTTYPPIKVISNIGIISIANQIKI
jgi:hypothetical protein